MIYYLTEKELVTINYSVIKQFSPSEDFGIKDPSALKSVVAQPQQTIYDKELYPSVYDKAAILFEKVINKHCFYNGNKRTAVMSLYIFLRKNGIHLTASNNEIADYAVFLTSPNGNKRPTNKEISKWIESNSTDFRHS